MLKILKFFQDCCTTEQASKVIVCDNILANAQKVKKRPLASSDNYIARLESVVPDKTKKRIESKKNWAVRLSDIQTPKNLQFDMFHRARKREFYGMRESDESKWKGNYDFVLLGDAQIGMGDQKEEEEFSRRAVEFINKRKQSIKFVIICGDHTHNLEDIWSKNDLEGGRRKRLDELKTFKKIYSKLDESIALVCVCGNHDVGNNPTKETIQLYKNAFGDDYYAFWRNPTNSQ